MYVCIYVGMHTSIYICVYVCMYICLYVIMYARANNCAEILAAVSVRNAHFCRHLWSGQWRNKKLDHVTAARICLLQHVCQHEHYFAHYKFALSLHDLRVISSFFARLPIAMCCAIDGKDDSKGQYYTSPWNRSQ